MKAVLLCGGRGTRLSPLTETVPKPLVRVLDVPVVEYTLAALAACGIKEAAVTVGYRAEQMKKALGETAHGVRLTYFEEEVPLGTAGAVRAASGFLDEDFLVLSGDALFDFSLQTLCEAYARTSALVTLGLTRNDAVCDYGVVKTERDGSIRSFYEKPSWQSVVSDLVNTGIYACRRAVLDRIPQTGAVDFSRDLFPALLQETGTLSSCELEGYWCDIGSPAALYEANMDALFSRVHLPPIFRGRFIGQGEGRSFVADGVRVLSSARFTKSVIGAYSELSASYVTGAVLGRGTRLSSGSRVSGALFGDGVFLDEEAHVEPSSVLGDGVRIEKGASVSGGRIVFPGEIVADTDGAFSAPSRRFSKGENVFSSPAKERLSECFDLGAASALLFFDALLCLASDEDAEGFARAFCAGRREAGKDTLLAVGAANMPLSRFCASFLHVPTVLFSSEEDKTKAEFCSETSLPLADVTLEALTRAFLHPAPTKTGEKGALRRLSDRDLAEAYRLFAARFLPDLSGKVLGLDESREARLLQELFVSHGARVVPCRDKTALLSFSFDARGRVSCYAREQFLCDEQHLRAALALSETRSGETLAVRSHLPRAVTRLLARRGVRTVVLDNDACPCGTPHPYLDDACLMVCAALGRFLKESPCLLPEAVFSYLSRVPSFALSEKEYEFDAKKSARFISRLWQEAEDGEELALPTPRGACRLSADLGRVKIFAEDVSAEAAEELCDTVFLQVDNLFSAL